MFFHFTQSKRYSFTHLILRLAAQRFALPALGRGRRSRPTGKMLRREKCLRLPQNPQRRVHALLARVFFIHDTQVFLHSYQDSWEVCQMKYSSQNNFEPYLRTTPHSLQTHPKLLR